MLIDTHSHQYARHFNPDLPESIIRAKAVCQYMLLPNIDVGSIPFMMKLADTWSDFCLPMMGLHPCSVDADYEKVLDSMEPLFATGRYVGVGEAGLDYFHDTTWVAEQKKALSRQITWAKTFQLPLVLHCRNSFEETIEMVEAAQDGSLTGVFHCFTGTAAEAKRVFDAGFYIGIGGVVTYKKNNILPETLLEVGLEKVVLETDSPYLPPEPHRGKRNETAYIALVANKIAQILGVPVQEVASITTCNASQLFRIPAYLQRQPHTAQV